MGPESIFSEPEGAIVILLRILVVLILFFDLDMGEVVQNSHEFKYGMIGSAKDFQQSMFIIGVPGSFFRGASNFFLPKLNPVLPKNILSGGAKFSNSVLPS